MLIVHHWDTDGICSAALIAKIKGDGCVRNITPAIGSFGFDDRVMEAIAQEEGEVFIVDLNIPLPPEISEKRVTFIDHHVPQKRMEGVFHINPVMDGEEASAFPSCTTVISDHFGSWGHLSALGAFGDVGIRAMEHPGISDAVASSGHPPDDFLRAVSLLDSNYVKVDREAVERAVLEVPDMDSIMLNRTWNDNMASIREAIKDALSRSYLVGSVAVVEFESPYNIISKVARKAVWESGYRIALVTNRSFNGSAQTYLRIADRSLMDMGSLIEGLKKMGFNAGGKAEVVGIVHPADRTTELHSTIKEHLKEFMEDI